MSTSIPSKLQEPNVADEDGLWIGVDLGTSNCACAIWDTTRGRPKWLRLGDLQLAAPEGRKDGRIVPSAVVLTSHHQSSQQAAKSQSCLVMDSSILRELQKLQQNDETTTPPSSAASHAMVGYSALHYILQKNGAANDEDGVPGTAADNTVPAMCPTDLVTSVKRVLGVCDTTRLKDLDPAFRASLPFSLLENAQGQWVIPVLVVDRDSSNNNTSKSNSNSTKTVVQHVRPIHVAAILLQAIRSAAHVYLQKAIAQKNMVVPGGPNSSNMDSQKIPVIRHVVVGVPAYFGQPQRQTIEQAARWAGFPGHISTLTESTAAAMAYGLFVSTAAVTNTNEKAQKAIMVLDMGGGTTDVTLAQVRSCRTNETGSVPDDDDDDEEEEESQQQPHFEVVLTEGDGRLGGDDMDHAVLEVVLQKLLQQMSDSSTIATTDPVFQGSQRQALLRQCKELKETLCGDVDHGDPPRDEASIRVTIPASKGVPQRTVEVVMTLAELERALQPLLERAAHLVQRSLQRYSEKLGKSPQEGYSSTTPLTQEVILIGGATRVPALRKMLRDRFFPPPHHPELCTSVNAMSAVAQGAAIQAAILSRQVPLHEVRSAMMLDITPHAIGVLLTTPTKDAADEDKDKGSSVHPTSSSKFIEILPRDSPLPAYGCAPFTLADIHQPGVTVIAAERITTDSGKQYQQVGEFTFLLHRLSKEQQDDLIRNHGGHRTVEIGMSLKNNGEFRVSVFDDRDPEHIRKKEVWQEYHRQKASSSNDENEDTDNNTLDYAPVKPMDLWQASEGITREEAWLIFLCSLLFVFYLAVKMLLGEPDESARIL